MAAATFASLLDPSKSMKIALPVNQSHTFLAINVNAFEPVAEFKRRMDALARQIKDAPKAKGAQRIWLPGEQEWERRAAALSEGIALPQDVRDSLKGLGDDLGVGAAFLGDTDHASNSN